MAYDSEPQVIDPAAPVDTTDNFEGVDALPADAVPGSEDLNESTRKSYY